jgi:cytoskeletal protein CcmA (bactofilin family)
MLFGNRKKHSARIDSLIGAGTCVEGDVIFAGGLRIDGEVKGDVRAAQDQPTVLVISTQARIEGEIHVAHCVINGTVSGTVHVAETLELQAGARVTGDVHYASLEMHQGAVVQGRLVHHSEAARGATLKLASSN